MGTTAKTNIPIENEKARNRAVVIVLSVTLVLLVGGILLMLFFPRIQAGIQYRRAVSALREATEADLQQVQIIDLYIQDPALDFRPLTANVYLDEEDDPAGFREDLLALSDDLHYDGRSASEAGGFDLEIRFTLTDGTRLDFYLLEDRLYLRVGRFNFYFAPKGEEAEQAYAAYEERVRLLLDEKRAAGER